MKKKIILIFVLAILLFSLTACFGGSPKSTIDNFVTALNEADANKLAELCIDELKEEAKDLAENIAVVKANDINYKVEISNIEFKEVDDGVLATFTTKAYLHGKVEEHDEQFLFLKKVDGKWLIASLM